MSEPQGNKSTDQHTPGPWCVVGRDIALEVVETRRNWMRVCFLTSDGACAANARLIAVAPDMLDALRAAEKDLATFEREMSGIAPEAKSPALPLIRAAIAKAEGRS